MQNISQAISFFAKRVQDHPAFLNGTLQTTIVPKIDDSACTPQSYCSTVSRILNYHLIQIQTLQELNANEAEITIAADELLSDVLLLNDVLFNRGTKTEMPKLYHPVGEEAHNPNPCRDKCRTCDFEQCEWYKAPQ